MTYPVIMVADSVNKQPDGDIQDRYQVTGFPVTFLIDGQGMIRFKRRGSFVESDDDLQAKIEELSQQAGKAASTAKTPAAS